MKDDSYRVPLKSRGSVSGPVSGRGSTEVLPERRVSWSFCRLEDGRGLRSWGDSTLSSPRSSSSHSRRVGNVGPVLVSGPSPRAPVPLYDTTPPRPRGSAPAVSPTPVWTPKSTSSHSLPWLLWDPVVQGSVSRDSPRD